MDVKTLCLGVLTLGDASGYEIRKQFEEGPFAHFFDASYGSIYPALGRLLKDDLVSVTEHAQNGKPDKKVYRLTPAGKKAFVDALSEDPTPDKFRSEFLVRFFFAELMSADQLEAVYGQYQSHFQGMADFLAGLDDGGVPAGRLFVRDMGRTFYKSMADHMAASRHQLLGAECPGKPNPEAAE